MKSYIAKPAEVQREWLVVDAQDKTLGRLASEIASILRGKHKPTYTPHVDMGDFVIVVNAEKIKVTGKKGTQKMYRWHTGYMGGLRERSFNEMMEKKPEEIIRIAVKGMLPKNSLGKQMINKLKIFVGPEHNHQAQMPKQIEL
jgi:large subunit ribosomal protein L13